MADLYAEGLLKANVASTVVPDAWSAAEFPSRILDDQFWRLLFRRARFTDDLKPAPRPSKSLRLWRGALPGHERGWSWTDDLATAQWFADREHNGGRGQVFTATVQPWQLLARISESRGESEWVVNTDGLTIEPAASLSSGAPWPPQR